MSGEDRVIDCRAATKKYASKPVLRGIHLVVEPGICALLGANGAGKSTLLRLLSGLEEPDSGSVFIGGLGFRDHGIRIRRNLGVLPEGLGLFESLTVIENLMAVVLLDEPFEGIDPASSAVIEMLLGQLSSDGATILLTSHILSIVQKIATRVVILHQGRVESDFDPSTTEKGVEEVYFSIVGKPQLEVAGWLRS